MKADELKEKLEERGYEVKSIREFAKSFHLNVWSPEAKYRYFFGTRIDEISWDDLKNRFPPVEVKKQ